MMFLMLSALVLSACGSEGSRPAQRAPNDVRLAQCELVDGTVLGAPTDPIMIDGVATHACRITNGQIKGGSRVDLKTSHAYQPLVWVLDGRLEIGDSRRYASLDEFVNGAFAQLGGVASGGIAQLRATKGSMIVVHRNGYFHGDVVSVDENLEGSGEWDGIVVNSIGSHPDCPSDTSRTKFCNVEGAHGFYGGLSASDSRSTDIGGTILPSSELNRLSRLGFDGSISEASASLVLNAPQTQNNARKVHVFDSAGTGVEINGGYSTSLVLIAQNAHGSAVRWHHDFGGSITGVIYHGQSAHAAVQGVGGDVDLNGVTLIDRDFTAGTAISVQGGRVDLTNVLVQNFRGCLQMDASSVASVTGVAFGCLSPTVAAEDGTDYGVRVTAAALTNADSAYYEADPALTADLRVGNAELMYTPWVDNPGGFGVIETIQSQKGHDLRLTYPDCMGIGTLLPENQTVKVGRTTYRICQLTGTIEASARLYSSFNENSFAWVLDGNVSLGGDFARLSAAEQLAALESPDYVFVPARTVVYGRSGASLTVQPSVQFFVDGTADNPVEFASLPGGGRWGGIRVYGVDRAECQTGSSAGVCAVAGARQLDIEYLRLLRAGEGQPALQLHEVGPGSVIDYLAIIDSASTGLALYGGRANLSHLALVNSAGDQMFWERGYRGTIRYGLLTSAAASAGQVLHGRNDSTNHDASPRSRPTLSNLTMIGQGGGAAILLEQGSGLLLKNSLVVDFANCLDIDDAATAALQSSTPQEIEMLDVVLSCGATLANDAEDAGSDYGHRVTSSSGVHRMDPQLDQNFVATNPALPRPAAGYWGAVGGADDGWYLGWSGVGVLLSPECDGKGTLVDDYQYRFSSGRPLQAYPGGSDVTIDLDYKVCKLPGLVSQDLELTRYTGVDAAVNADGYVEITQAGNRYGIEGQVRWIRVPVPTIWLLDGIVTVGNGAIELSTVEEATALKGDPVELTLRPGTWVMATQDGGMHITRGGRLQILGDPMLEDEYCEYGMYGWACTTFATTGPVSMFGEISGAPLPYVEINYSATGEIYKDEFAVDIFGGYAPYAPLGTNSYDFFGGEHYRQFSASWQGITVDGFARNNLCEEAATAQPGSRVCNIGGELGFHGGYDNDHANLEINNLYMIGGQLQLNSVAGLIDGLTYQHNRFADEQVGEAAVIEIDGGIGNLRDVVIDFRAIEGSRKPGTLIGWNHGYQGSMQYIYGTSAQIADGSEHRVQANGREYFIPLLRGANGEAGHENDLPRSMPTIANLSLRSHESDSTTGEMTAGIDSSFIELVRGSGLYLYHSVMGATEGDNKISDYCFKIDASAAERVSAGELVVRQLATTCESLTDNVNVSLDAMSGVNNTYAGSMAVFGSSSEQQYVDQFGPDPIQVNHERDRYYPLQQAIDDFGHVELDVTSSPTADSQFLQLIDYLGTLDYWNKPW